MQIKYKYFFSLLLPFSLLVRRGRSIHTTSQTLMYFAYSCLCACVFVFPWLFCLSWSIWHLCERGRTPFAVWSVFCWLLSTVLTTILIFVISFIINYYEGDGKLIILTVIILFLIIIAIIITIITTVIMRLVCIVLRPRISGFCVVVALLLLLLLSSPWHADEGTSR